MPTTVVNIHHGEDYDVYIGRGRGGIWGNPFSHLPGTLAKYQVASRAEAIGAFERWFLAQPEMVERARRELTGKRLGCFCGAGRCHGDVYVRVCDGEPAGTLFNQ